MKIGIDVRTACGQKTGKGWYTYHLVKELLALDKKNEYILYTNNITADLAVFHGAHIKVIHKNPFLWHFAVIKDFLRSGGELFFAPTSFIIPAFLPRRVKSIITVHDLVAFLHPHLHHTKSTILEHLFFKMALKKTRHVLVPSDNTKKDLMRVFHYKVAPFGRTISLASLRLGLPEEKITVTPLGVDEAFLRHGELAESMARVRKKYWLPEEFILTVAGLEPRKNVGMLIDALSLLITHPPPLVIVGGKGWKSKKLQQKIIEAGPRVIQIEKCDPEDLSKIYRLAKVFVYPSLYEGFGLPPLEAMASGCPVICSNAASLPEVVGEAALTFDPHNENELTAQLEKLLSNEAIRRELSEKGKKQASKFSWVKTAEQTLKVFHTV